MNLSDPATIERAVGLMTQPERDEFFALIASDTAIWRPQVGRQMEALDSDADIIGYGGAAGGGKTDLIAGLALTQHRRALVLRREKTQTEGIIQRITEILGSSDGYNSQKSQWRIGDRLIEFGGLDGPADHQKWQGRPHDLKALDEVTEMREHQARFVMGWSRTSTPGQRVRNLLTFNPPTTAEGRWVIDFFGPWLNDKHPNPAKPGEMRWFTTLKGKDVEVPSGERFVIFREEPLYDFDPSEFSAEKIIIPKSRTFVPSRVTDNYFYVKTGYIDTLQSMPEPLRSQMLNGDFNAGVEDDRWQVIPTAWIDAAMARWQPRVAKEDMDSMGVDAAMGGKDAFTIARRHGWWFDEVISTPGVEVPDGQTGAALVVKHRRNQAVVMVDVIGVGSSSYNFLQSNGVQCVGVNASATDVTSITVDGRLRFVNKRAELVWRMREALDPLNQRPISLPPDNELRADLAAYKWELRPGGIFLKPKDQMRIDLGRSPDKGDAVCMALEAHIKVAVLNDMLDRVANYDRYAELQEAR